MRHPGSSRTSNMLRWALATAAAGSVLAVACGREMPPAADVVVRIEGRDFAYDDFEARLRSSVDGGELSLDSAVLSRLFDQLVDEILLERLAADRGLLEEGAGHEAIETLLAQEAAARIEPSAVEAYYREHAAEFHRPETVHLRQILVHDRPEAEAAAQALAGGEDFAEVARRVSVEPNAKNGGDQGWLALTDLPPAFAETIFALGDGEASEIVAADYGFHIFQVIGRRSEQAVPIEAVAGRIREQLQRRQVDQQVRSFLEEARRSYNVEIFPPNFPFDYQGHYAR